MHLSTHTWMRPEPLERTLQRAQSLGYQSIELAGEPDKHPVPETLELLNKYNISCWGAVTVMSGKRSLITADAKVRQDSVEYVKNVVALCSALGGSIVTVVPGTVGTIVAASSPEVEWQYAIDSLKEICAFASERRIRIAVEPLNRFETHFINRVDQALCLAKEVGYANCGIALDSFHQSIEERDLFDSVRRAGDRVFDVHLGENNRLPPGDGNINWTQYVQVLREIGYAGGLAHESMPPIDRTPASPYKAMGGQIDDDPEDVDADTLQFIIDHGSGVFSDKYYTSVLKRCADTILPLL
jgi:D-psicose/D-tagatose/L-ribulose 3-epimerase